MKRRSDERQRLEKALEEETRRDLPPLPIRFGHEPVTHGPMTVME